MSCVFPATKTSFELDANQDMAPRELMAKDVISLIKLLPDELPCHLAGLCRLSCRDVITLPGDSSRSNIV